jgi:hypothetical protein
MILIDTHLFDFRRGLVPYRFEFGNRWTVLLEVIDREEVTSTRCVNENGVLRLGLTVLIILLVTQP